MVQQVRACTARSMAEWLVRPRDYLRETLGGVGAKEPCAQAFDFRAVGGPLWADQAVANAGTSVETIAAITRVVTEAAVDQRVDLALNELVQSGRLDDAKADCRIRGAKTVRAKPRAMEPVMHSNRQDPSNSGRF